MGWVFQCLRDMNVKLSGGGNSFLKFLCKRGWGKLLLCNFAFKYSGVLLYMGLWSFIKTVEINVLGIFFLAKLLLSFLKKKFVFPMLRTAACKHFLLVH